MNNQEKEKYLRKFQEYKDYLHKACDYWCDTCKFGVMIDSGNGYSCPFDVIITEMENEIYE